MTEKTQIFIEKVKAKFGHVFSFNSTIYKTNRTNVIITCKKHGDFTATPWNLLKSPYGCMKCALTLKKTRLSNKDKFIEKAIKIHGDRYIYDKIIYTGGHKKTTIECKIHGSFQQSPSNHLRGSGCPKCAVANIVTKQIKTKDIFIKEAKLKHDNKYDYSKADYLGAHRKLTIVCPIHGEFKQTANSHLRGNGCDKCLYKNQVKLYLELKRRFPNNVIKYEFSPTWLGRQRFDMYFVKENIAVEYNGKQHYTPVRRFGGKLGLKRTIERDQRKRLKCIENNCALFELRYDYTPSDLESLIIAINNAIKNKNK